MYVCLHINKYMHGRRYKTVAAIIAWNGVDESKNLQQPNGQQQQQRIE